MQALMKIQQEKIFHFQQLVKSYGLHFVGRHYVSNGFVTVVVDGEGLPMQKCNEFFQAWNRLNTPIVEIAQKSKFQRFVKKAKHFFSFSYFFNE
jgi:hypothetical protein